ncbi:MAG: trypsin-like serine protease [Actinobacteria bacterium]|uniref:Unannotated protein n=1 Tax=freshwater metagenome TaxID=449393 RepID=A0A6J6N919_9ZZZZ|nr:trypsin-like serine protease [Actinomycetota bacterium]
MRGWRLGVVVAVAATAGGAVALIVGDSTGWIGSSRPVLSPPPSSSDGLRQIVVAKPVLSRSFRPAKIYAQRSPGVVTISSEFAGPENTGIATELGSGFVVSLGGAVLTAAHVITQQGQSGVEPAEAVFVTFPDGDRLKAKIVGWDLIDDVGVLTIDPDAHDLRPIPIGDSRRLTVGEPVAAIGSPLGGPDALTVGVISALQRVIPSLITSSDLLNTIQIDAPIAHGNSGGPILNAKGEAIGIAAQTQIGPNGGFDGVGYAVPIHVAQHSLNQLLSTGHVLYAWAGVSAEDLTPAIAKRFGYAARHGALVDGIALGGPAASAGIQPGHKNVAFLDQQITVGGDAVVAVDGIPVTDANDLARIVAEDLRPGEYAHFAIVRGRQRLSLRVQLGSRSYEQR